jgi:exopolyphosphatase/guanosine-5'-triphosphate,3'-diphosphate pyrophosphatase
MTDHSARRYAALDIGTNSIKFHIGERLADGSWGKVVDRAEVVGLGEGLRETGEFSEASMARAITAIIGMTGEARDNDVAAIVAVATMGMRNARNAGQFIAAVQAGCGISIEVISGEEEARLAYLAVKAGLGLPEVPLVVFDTGGGSTQFTFGHGASVNQRFSLNVGAARFTEHYRLDNAVSETTLREAIDAIGAELSRLDTVPAPHMLIGMGGAVTNMVAVKLKLASYDSDAVQGAILTRAEIELQIEQYRLRSAEQRRAIIGLQQGRAEVILAGACIVKTVLDKFHMDALIVSDHGLRHGLLVERFPG